MSVYQADVGECGRGRIDEEHGRALPWDRSGEGHIINGDWNTYEVIAKGNHVGTFINGQTCVDLEDSDGDTDGIIVLRLHSGGKQDVRFRKISLEVLSQEAETDE